MFSKLFQGATVVDAEIDVAAPMARSPRASLRANGWVDEWGQDARLLVLTHGLSLAHARARGRSHQRRRPGIGAGSAGQCPRPD